MGGEAAEKSERRGRSGGRVWEIEDVLDPDRGLLLPVPALEETSGSCSTIITGSLSAPLRTSLSFSFPALCSSSISTSYTSPSESFVNLRNFCSYTMLLAQGVGAGRMLVNMESVGENMFVDVVATGALMSRKLVLEGVSFMMLNAKSADNE